MAAPSSGRAQAPPTQTPPCHMLDSDHREAKPPREDLEVRPSSVWVCPGRYKAPTLPPAHHHLTTITLLTTLILSSCNATPPHLKPTLPTSTQPTYTSHRPHSPPLLRYHQIPPNHHPTHSPTASNPHPAPTTHQHHRPSAANTAALKTHLPPYPPTTYAHTTTPRNLRLRLRTAEPSPPKQSGPQPLKCALLNTRSLRAHATDIHDLILSNQLDILALTETWLKSTDGPTLSLAIPPDYSILRSDRPTSSGGGVAFIHRTTIPLRTTPTIDLPSTEALTVKLTTDPETTTTLLLLYRTPGPAHPFTPPLLEYLTTCTKPRTKLLLLGDLNLGLHDPTDHDATTLLAALSDLGFSQRITEPTHTHGRTIDWVADLNCHITDTSNNPCPWSDHHLLQFSIPRLIPPPAIEPPPLLS